MSDNFLNNILSSKVINSYNFARLSHFVFSETVTHKQFIDLNIDNKYIVYKNEYLITYKLDYVDLRENNIIFTNTKYLNDLFYLLNKCSNLKNIKLITHQTDIPITKKKFSRKPYCVSKWFSINVDYLHENLIPIPLGLANDYSPKNLLSKDIIYSPIKDKKLQMYLNFNPNTNSKKRNKIYKNYQDSEIVYIDLPNESLKDYAMKLSKNAFILCPWGNGYDTHRFWETIYSGSVPITENHITYNTAKDLPVIFVNDILKVSNNELENFIKSSKFQNYNFEKLNIDYWNKLIKLSNISSSEVQYVKFNKTIGKFFIFFHKVYDFAESKKKKIIYKFKFPLRAFKKLKYSLINII